MGAMGGASRQPRPSLMELLRKEPYRFDFFQAVRILTRASRCGAETAEPKPLAAYNNPLGDEAVFFRSAHTLSFPSAPIQRVDTPTRPEKREASIAPCAEMTVNFMGLTGPCGVLPQHYTERIRRDKDRSLSDFLDIFNQRAIALFVQAWEKYRLTASYERAGLDLSDPISAFVCALAGFGTEGLLPRLKLPTRTLLFYAGHFSRAVRPAATLEAVIGEYFNVQVEVKQFAGRWHRLNQNQQSAAPSREHPEGAYAQLGENAVAGDRIWEVESTFEVCVGPLPYKRFATFFPNANERALKDLGELVRLYVGAELNFDIQVVLREDEVPPCQLPEVEDYQPFLGWNTWLPSDRLERYESGVVFEARTK